MTSPPLHLDTETFRKLLQLQGPSLGLWRAAEIAVLRQQKYDRPILDLGCGDGLVTSMVLPQVEIGIDPNESALIQAESRKIYDRLIPLPLEKANIPDASISTIISNSVLEHIPELDIILQTVARILKPGGKLILTTPTEAFSQWLTLPIKPYSNWRNRQLEHLNLWSVETWTEQLEKVGLKVEIVQPILNRELVSIWDSLELLQQIWIAKKRVFGVIWRRIPLSTIDKMAEWFSQLDLSTSTTGGGRLIVARKIDINL
ncbi:class I SAM-dependent methyltransferase [Aerosakkonemataceae cyanobacterium BLCC-F154]|uniref:Class I SAM-dependent methyltransferase n=1 Tax=Floridaenema fluviatile BLCC-F154 TaxID=3153640 RepID=A0ABV4YGF1_9CYAN